MGAFGKYDILLLVLVSAQATAVAYLFQPKWKALVFSFPIPFTFGSLALGRPVDATNVLALVGVILFLHAVRVLYSRLRVPIVASIAVSTLGYCLVGWKLAAVVPS